MSEHRSAALENSALVIIDVQSCFTRPLGTLDTGAEPANVTAFYERVNGVVIPNLQKLLATFRSAAAPIYFTEMGSLRSDGGDLPSALRRANDNSIAATGRPVVPPLDDAGARVDERIAPREDEVVLRKTTTGTLASSPLAQNLRALDTSNVAVAGIVTDCCVAQTARELADQDFDVTVVADGCASYVTAHHEAVLEIFENFYGSVRPTLDITVSN